GWVGVAVPPWGAGHAVRAARVPDAGPPRRGTAGRPALEIVLETPRYGMTWFRVLFGKPQVKAYTKGENVLRLEATVHNARELRCRRDLAHFDQITDRLARLPGPVATALGCGDRRFPP